MNVMTKALDSLGIKTVVCMTTNAAIKAVQAHQFDCAFIDWGSNDDCVELMQVMRNNNWNEKAFVTAICKYFSVQASALTASANTTINKPQNFGQAVRSIQLACASVMMQRRSSYLIPVDWHATVVDQLGQTRNIRIEYISETGITFRSKAEYQLSEQFKLTFRIPFPGYETVTANADLAGRNQDGSMVAKFTVITPRHKAMIINWVADEVDDKMSANEMAPTMNHQLIAA